MIILLSVLFVATGMVLGSSAYVKNIGSGQIITGEEAAQLEDVDCILVLGCRVYDNGSPSPMLRDRLARAVELYNMGVSPILLMSGDHGREEYNEVGSMKRYAINAGIPSSDVFMDHAGFSTYESIYRAKEIFGAKKIIVVTQEYHLHRALYIAKQLGLEAYGVSSDYRMYAGKNSRELRETLARFKDFITTIYRPAPTYMGDVICLSGDGNITNDGR